MKEYKRKFVTYQPFDYEGIQEYLERMAADGWRLVSIGTLWTFKRLDPASIHYTAAYLPRTSQYDPDNNPAISEFDDYCLETGWTRVCSSGNMHIYCSAEENPVPIDTDESIKLDNVRKSAVRSFVLPMLIMVGCLCMIGNSFISFFTKPVETFSSYANMTVALMSLLAAVMTAVGIVNLCVWVRKSRILIEAGGHCASTGGFRKIYRLVYSLIFVTVLLWLVSETVEENVTASYGAIFLAAVFWGIILLVRMLTKKMRARGTSATVNRIVSVAVCFICTFTAIFAVTLFLLNSADETAAGNTTYRTSLMEMKSESIPLGDTEAESADSSIGDDNDNAVDCTILRINNHWLYEKCLNQWLNEDYEIYEMMGIPSGDNDKYRREDTEDWGIGANALYRYYFAGEPEDQWIMCYPGMIVKLEPYNQLSEEDFSAIDRMVRGITEN